MNKATFLMMAAAGAIASVTLPAAAADLGARPYLKAPVQTEALHSWAGFYVGAHVGYAWGDQHDNLSVIGAMVDKFDVKGVMGGIHAGYNWQANNFVFGIEGDFHLSDVKGNRSFDDPVGGSNRIRGNLGFANDWQASLRARAGFAQNNWLLYATGGVAFADVKSSLSIKDNYCVEGTCYWNEPTFSSAKNTLVGYTIGIGSEFALTRNWIGRAEVRYTDFGNKTFALSDQDGFPAPTRVKFDQVNATVGISYKF